MTRLLLSLVLCAWVATARGAEGLLPFAAGSYAQIVDSYRGRPFLLAFWSIDCPPCHRELKQLGEMGAGTRFAAVIVSTDGAESAETAAQLLREYGVSGAELWRFDGAEMPIRAAVDRTWFGELPRSYLFDKAGKRTAVTGVLERSMLEPLAK